MPAGASDSSGGSKSTSSAGSTNARDGVWWVCGGRRRGSCGDRAAPEAMVGKAGATCSPASIAGRRAGTWRGELVFSTAAAAAVSASAAAVVSIEGETASEQAGRLEPSAVSPASHTLSVVRSRSKSSWRHRSASRRRVRVAEAGGPELGAATTASERPGRSVPAFDA